MQKFHAWKSFLFYFFWAKIKKTSDWKMRIFEVNKHKTKWTEKEKQKLIIEPWICTYILSISHMCCSLWIEEIENCLKTKNSSTAKSQRSAHFLLYLEPSKRNAYRINWSFFSHFSWKKKERIDRNYFTDSNRLKHSERFTSANVAIVASDGGGFLFVVILSSEGASLLFVSIFLIVCVWVFFVHFMFNLRMVYI